MISRKFEIDIDTEFGNKLWLFLRVLMAKFPDEIKELDEK